jgi:peptidoglycan/LPS O-acetylase OafA/YrhL
MISPASPLANESASDRDYAAFQQRSFFASLDGLRAFSILAVIWHHACASAFPAERTLAHEGFRGVTLFFAISAFLISTLLLRARRRGSLAVGQFWCRRALRILPLYYAMLLVYIVVVGFAESDGAARQGFFAHLKYFATFTSNWFVTLEGPRVIFYFAWSLAAEEQFYLVWPWVERELTRFGPAVIALVGLVVSQLAAWEYLQGTHALPVKILASVPPAILLGVVLAHVLDSPRGFRWMRAVVGRRGSAVVAIVVALAALGSEPQLGFLSDVAASLSLVVVVATCVVREDNDLAPLLRLRPVAWIGTVSYGIYLMHMLCISAVRAALHAAHVSSITVLFVGSAAASIAVASLSYLTYESFFLRRKERWFGNRTASVPKHPAPVPVSVAPSAVAPEAVVPNSSALAARADSSAQ